ncbi:MAG: 50S ribosomal protein L24 [Nanobdellota archaeon]
MSVFSKSWNKSVQPRKQRKYRYNIPMHKKGRLLNVHLSPSLRKKHGIRAIRVRKGDTVKVSRGSFKSKSGKVEQVMTSKLKVYINGIEVSKVDGSKAKVPVDPSNIIITELDTSDKKRMKRIKTYVSKQANDEKSVEAKDTKVKEKEETQGGNKA